jgi:hypothetical protein
MTNREKMMSVFMDALSSVLPGNLVRDTLKYKADILTIEGEKYRLGDYRGVHVFGSGKASIETARAVKSVLGDRSPCRPCELEKVAGTGAADRRRSRPERLLSFLEADGESHHDRSHGDQCHGRDRPTDHVKNVDG